MPTGPKPSATLPSSSSASEERRREWADDAETEATAIPASTDEAAGELQTFLIVRQSERVAFLDLNDPGEWVVGRAPDADVVVDDRQVSRKHATLRLASGVLSIEDLGSRNGTLVNGRALMKDTARIGAGDAVEVLPQMRNAQAARRGVADEAALLRDLCETLKFGSLCALGGFTPYPVLSALEHFPEDFGLEAAHVAA